MSRIEIQARLTAKNQVTVPLVVREVLKLGELDEIKFVISKSGQVWLEKAAVKPGELVEDPTVLSYLAFLDKDITTNPQRLSPLNRSSAIEAQMAEVEIDLNLDFNQS